ncbi:MAG: hypothetical protein JNK12_01135 [Acidimicrobiales bacterium]|nr:hypothetical protein [Acidimicrobiales bacterium]
MRRGVGWGIGIAVLALGVAAAGSTFAGAQGDDTRRGTDPLSAEEVRAALDDGGVSPESGAPESAGPESLGANGLPEHLVLLVERHVEDKGADDLRRADVYEYSYADDTLTVSLVDLADGTVDDTQVVQGTQLPLVEVEAQRALDLLFADPDFRERLDAEHLRATGAPLVDPAAELIVEPIVFLAEAVPTVAQGEAAECGIHRCAQFLIQTDDHVLINLFPLVDLSDGVVLTADGVGGT